MRLYTIIVTYNAQPWIEKCLNSLAQIDIDNTIIVVDNSSSDNTVEIIKESFPEVLLIVLAKNIGFGKANNLGIQEAVKQGADYVFLLNQDAYFYKGSVKKMLDLFNKETNIGLISPIHLSGDASNLDFAFFNYLNPNNTNLVSESLQQKNKPFYYNNFINAAAWFIKISTINKIGLFHPIFEHYGEDEEYCIRLQKNGLKLAIYIDVCILHDRPQNRNNNLYFHPYKKLRRSLLLSYFKNNQVAPDGETQFFKLAFWYLIKFNFNYCFNTIKEFKKYKKDLCDLENE